MSSLIPGYTYDIFISYRQKDNKHDGWVTEFVDNLKGELESTFKEEISVYFDINPHDGLLETHDVDESLRDKLKCLIFIPIISRTYCDPKSFAWEHEFKAFIGLASEDHFGLKIKLPNGNVASRVLPVQIHDLYPEDKAAIEKELGGVLRAIEFIYKEPGVNKPLTNNDDERKNLNNTKYRIQVNKVANAIEEVIHGLKSPQSYATDKSVQSDHGGTIVKNEGQIKEKTGVAGTGMNLKRWLVAGGAAVLLLALVYGIFRLIENKKQAADISNLEKSIAVLPFFNDSPDQENTYFINGIMDEILNNLQKIKDFRVLSRTSTEQYRGANKPAIPKIAKDLDVNYIVEGSGQKYGNTVRLRVQLIAARNEKHLWGESFEQEIRETKDIFKIQSQIAQAIASELEATITPEEKDLIEKTSTTNLTAYDFYQRGRENLTYSISGMHNQSILTAERMFKKALGYDSTFALAYYGLAEIYFRKHVYDSYYSEKYLDSSLILSNLALSFDKNLAQGYFGRGVYFLLNGNTEQTLKEFDIGIKLNPNDYTVYEFAAHQIYLWNNYYADYVKAIEYLQKAASLNHGNELPNILYWLGYAYGNFAGFPEKAKYYYQEAFNLDGDSIRYFNEIAILERCMGNTERSYELAKTNLLRDTNNLQTLQEVGTDAFYLGRYKESLKYYKKYSEGLTKRGEFQTGSMLPIGYVYWKNGYKKEAEYWFNEQKKLSEEAIKRGRTYASWGYAKFDLAVLNMLKGDKEKALEYLRMLGKMKACPLLALNEIRKSPLYESIRNDPDFQPFIKDMESKYQAEHERVRKWLEEQGKL